jgi:hypothetical protein
MLRRVGLGRDLDAVKYYWEAIICAPTRQGSFTE